MVSDRAMNLTGDGAIAVVCQAGDGLSEIGGDARSDRHSPFPVYRVCLVHTLVFG
jgi:hypothetical protein